MCNMHFLKVKISEFFKTQAEISSKLKSISSKLNFPATTVVAVARKVCKKKPALQSYLNFIEKEDKNVEDVKFRACLSDTNISLG